MLVTAEKRKGELADTFIEVKCRYKEAFYALDA